MSSTSNPNLENNNDEKDDKAKKPKKKVELFPPLEKRPEAPKIDVLIDNTCIYRPCKTSYKNNINKNTSISKSFMYFIN